MSANNDEIAQLFEDMAVLLEMKGDSVFKIRAYQRAARTIENLSFSLDKAVQEGTDLKTIPGVGKAISDKIQELLSTGKVSTHQTLLAEHLTLGRALDLEKEACSRHNQVHIDIGQGIFLVHEIHHHFPAHFADADGSKIII